MFAGEPFRCVHSGTDFSPMTLDEGGAYIARVRHPRELRGAVDRIVSDVVMSEAAASRAAELRTENGTTAACDAIEAVLGTVPRNAGFH